MDVYRLVGVERHAGKYLYPLGVGDACVEREAVVRGIDFLVDAWQRGQFLLQYSEDALTDGGDVVFAVELYAAEVGIYLYFVRTDVCIEGVDGVFVGCRLELEVSHHQSCLHPADTFPICVGADLCTENGVIPFLADVQALGAESVYRCREIGGRHLRDVGGTAGKVQVNVRIAYRQVATDCRAVVGDIEFRILVCVVSVF